MGFALMPMRSSPLSVLLTAACLPLCSGLVHPSCCACVLDGMAINALPIELAHSSIICVKACEFEIRCHIDDDHDQSRPNDRHHDRHRRERRLETAALDAAPSLWRAVTQRHCSAWLRCCAGATSCRPLACRLSRTCPARWTFLAPPWRTTRLAAALTGRPRARCRAPTALGAATWSMPGTCGSQREHTAASVNSVTISSCGGPVPQAG
jgi:hypothetical protein